VAVFISPLKKIAIYNGLSLSNKGVLVTCIYIILARVKHSYF